MNAFHRQLVLTILLAGVAGFVGVWVGARRVDASLYAPAAPLPTAVDELARHGLGGLTQAQKIQISTVDQHYLQTRLMLRERISSANAELSEALGEEMGFGPSVERSIKDLESAVGELQRQAVIYVLELREVLTPPQRATFDEKVMAALMTDTGTDTRTDTPTHTRTDTR